jgi:DNA-binding MarR family transcriptional regulator
MTPLMEQILGCIEANGECSPAELNRHLLIDSNRLGAPLLALERRGLIGRNYTTHMAARDGGHSYVLTAEGLAVYAEIFGDD